MKARLILHMKNRLFLYLPEKLARKQPIVLFDGGCHLCSSSVRFLIRNNNSGDLNFAALQSETASQVFLLAGKSFHNTDTLLLIQDNILNSYSTAALKLAIHLGFPWRLFGIFMLVPAVIRDAIYRYVARNRYKWFGRKSLCNSDKEGIEHRFLD